MRIENGYRKATCRECGAEGLIQVAAPLSRDRYKIRDEIPHEKGCSKFVAAQPKHFRAKHWRGQEKRANQLVGARATIASGAIGADGDGRRIHEWRVESKQTNSEHYLLTQAVWGKLVTGALQAGEEPLLHVEVRHPFVERYVVIREEAYTGKRPQSETVRTRVRIHHADQTPRVLELQPPGVLLTEHQFEEEIIGPTKSSV